MLIEQIIELLAEHTGKDASEITAESTFDSLGIDSLDTVDLLMNLEDILGVELRVEEKVSTVGELAELLKGQVPQ